MSFARARRPLLIAGIAILVVAAVAVAMAIAATGSTLMGMECSGSGACTTESPVLFTLLNFVSRSIMPLVVAGIVLVAASLTVQAITTTSSTDPANGAPMTPDESDPGEIDTRPVRAARRLWILTAALLVTSTALGLWSASPAAQNVSMGCYGSGGCPAPPLYVLNQLAYTLVPSGMLAGMLVLGLALLVTTARRLRPAPPLDASAEQNDIRTADGFAHPSALAPAAARDTGRPHPDAVWDGRSHDPFRRPEPDSGR